MRIGTGLGVTGTRLWVKKLCMVLIDGLGKWDKVQMSQTVLKLMEINISVFGHSKMG